MKVLSLFGGIECGKVACERAGLNVDAYYSSEIDKYAIQITQKNHPDAVLLGNINNWKNWDIDWASIDLIIGGSPCQGFSVAGTQLNFDDERSKLFFVFVDILNHIKTLNPNVLFLLENVKMKKEFEQIVSQFIGVEPIEINSALVSAQNRKRLYWTNISDLQQPNDKNIFLKDIVHENTWVDREKSLCITSTYYKGGNLDHYFNKSKRQVVFIEPLNTDKFSTKYRHLTPMECERLQNLPDDYTAGISKTQRYKCIGNGWTVDVITHILKNITKGD